MKILSIFSNRPKNYQKIDNTVSRSAQPTKRGIFWLKRNGVTDVVNFRTMGRSGINYDEEKLVTKNGMNYYSLKSVTRKPDEKNISRFLEIVDNVKQKGGKLHIHCKAGADRTGMYAYIYECLYNIKTAVEAKYEWFKHGYHFKLYPKLMEWTDNFVKNYKK